MKYYKILILFLIIFFQIGVIQASTTDGIIDNTYRSALVCEDESCSASSQINFKPTLGTPIHITDTAITGNAWGEDLGWINFNPTNGGVKNTSSGVLSGYAWGDGAGWINFNPTLGGVTINTSGQFVGYAWSENYGWIKFDCNVTNACVITDWRPLSVRDVNTGGGGGSSSSGSIPDKKEKDVCPNINGTQTSIPNGLVITSAGNCIKPEQCNVIDGALKQPLDVVIIVDKSGSMSGTKISQAKIASDAFINNLVPGSDRVGYVSYSDKANLVEGLSYSLDEVNNKIQKTTVGGNTNIGGALKIAHKELKNNGRNNVKRVIILMTDGEANVSDDKKDGPNQNAINNSVLAKMDGMILYTVGLGSSVDSNLLKLLATYTTNYYYSPTGVDLSNIYLKIAAIECTAAPSKVFDTVYYDKNGNGLYDNGEKGIPNISVSLVSSDGSHPTRTVVSDSDGGFMFNNVAAGSYSLCLDIPEGMKQTLPSSGGCYSLNVIQGINVSSLKFMITGSIKDIPVTPVTEPSIPENPPVVATVEPVLTDMPVSPVDNVVTPPVAPTIIPEPTIPPKDNEVSKVEDNKSITSKITNFFGSILGSSHNGEGLAITQNSFTELGEKINSVVYFAGKLSQGMINNTVEVFESGAGKVTSIAVSTGGALTGLYFGVVNTAFASPVSFAEIFLTPMRLWSLLLIALGIKKRRSPWGTVYDSVTKQPLDPAYVVLEDLTGKEIATSITDLDGRYGFLVPPGVYRIKANKTNYQFPSKKLEGKNNDALYSDLYFNEIIEIKEGDVIARNIPMDPLKFDWNEFAKNEQKLMRFFSRKELFISRLTDILFNIGFIVSFISVLISPTIFNFLVLFLYLLMIILQKTILKPRAYGHVSSKETKLPLPFSIIRIFFDGNDNEVLHKVTDKTGKYYCLIPNGTYYAKIENKNLDESYSYAYTSEVINVDKGYINKKFEI